MITTETQRHAKIIKPNFILWSPKNTGVHKVLNTSCRAQKIKNKSLPEAP